MKNLITILLVLFALTAINGQTKPTTPAFSPLPSKLYKVLRDSCTQIDVVFTNERTGSMSLEGRNVIMFSTFVTPTPIVAKKNATKMGFIMWQRNGREFITGDIYIVSETEGYVYFRKDEKEYFNQLTPQGANMLGKNK